MTGKCAVVLALIWLTCGDLPAGAGLPTNSFDRVVVGEHELRDVRIREWEGERLVITHSRGTAKIPRKLLPAVLRDAIDKPLDAAGSDSVGTDILTTEGTVDEGRWREFRDKYEGVCQVKASILTVTGEGLVLYNGSIMKCKVDEASRTLKAGKRERLSDRFIFVYTDSKGDHKEGDVYEGLVYLCDRPLHMHILSTIRKVETYAVNRAKADWVKRTGDGDRIWKW